MCRLFSWGLGGFFTCPDHQDFLDEGGTGRACRRNGAWNQNRTSVYHQNHLKKNKPVKGNMSIMSWFQWIESTYDFKPTEISDSPQSLVAMAPCFCTHFSLPIFKTPKTLFISGALGGPYILVAFSLWNGPCCGKKSRLRKGCAISIKPIFQPNQLGRWSNLTGAEHQLFE